MNMPLSKPYRNAVAIDLDRCHDKSDRQRKITRRTQALLAAAGMEEPDRKWFVVEVETGCDRTVAQAFALSDVEVWVPYVAFKPKRRGGMQKGPRPILEQMAMPGYLFVKVAAVNDAWSGLAKVKGVSGILGSSNGRPIPVADDKVALFRKYLAGDPHAVAIVTNMAKPGDEVRVKDGPFASFPGKVGEVDADRGRALVEILMFGRVTPVHLDLVQIAKL